MLNPVDDTRMFEKMGQSLAATGLYEVHIIGFSSSAPVCLPGITFHPAPVFSRLSAKRILRPFAILREIYAIKPSVLIITTHELLIAGVLARIFTGTRLVYDVRENYFRNILYLPSFPLPFRLPIAVYVRLKEILLAPAVNLFVLSDEGYRRELPFSARKLLVVKNKASDALFRQGTRQPAGRTTELLFSGTLAASTGVFTAIELATRLHAIDNTVRLTIIGYCARHTTFQKIQRLIKGKDFIRLTGGDRLVPHPEIIDAIYTAHFGIVAYPPNPSSVNTVPTKLYEYLAARLPILMTAHEAWHALCHRYQAAIPFSPANLDAPALLQSTKTHTFYQTIPGPEVSWTAAFEKMRERMLDAGC